MPPEIFLTKIVDPGLTLLVALGGPKPTNDARQFLVAVALQESGLTARYQGSPAASPGPARGWLQFEQGGGVHGVLTHPASAELAASVCAALYVVPTSAAVWRCLEGNGPLAAVFGRLLLFTDPHPIPTTETAAWDCYLRLWRPGKPHPDVWPNNWKIAQQTVARVAMSSATWD